MPLFILYKHIKYNKVLIKTNKKLLNIFINKLYEYINLQFKFKNKLKKIPKPKEKIINLICVIKFI